MIFYKTSSFGNDFIEIDLADVPEGPVGLAGREAERAVRPPSPRGTARAVRPPSPREAAVPHGDPAARDRGELARAVCDRQHGVGADGAVFYRMKSSEPHFEIYNRDGGAAELSGNGMAGLAAVLLQRRLAASPLVLRTAVGRRRIELLERRGPRYVLDVEIGVPRFAARGFFPFLRGGCRGPYSVAGVEFYPVSVGNPHAVVLWREPLAKARLAALGARIAGHPIFPRQVNVEFVQPSGEERCRVFFFERGVGPTRASSTGSAAVFAVLRRLGLARERLEIEGAAAAGGGGEPVQVGWRNGITVRNVTQLVCRGEFFL